MQRQRATCGSKVLAPRQEKAKALEQGGGYASSKA
eukprot:CAMPEP_0179167472 /NCGR_PEP_ID=MMETSP0796-20121207/82337_1 /TAXON_ID=73915 /ORGANISM="Pyrodinium bahamense, Strain pbaha01" /LENGTH=34 /DNA_ID= /DNA_START= /DNA_END= /DNA_ORIENTATION=